MSKINRVWESSSTSDDRRTRRTTIFIYHVSSLIFCPRICLVISQNRTATALHGTSTIEEQKSAKRSFAITVIVIPVEYWEGTITLEDSAQEESGLQLGTIVASPRHSQPPPLQLGNKWTANRPLIESRNQLTNQSPGDVLFNLIKCWAQWRAIIKKEYLETITRMESIYSLNSWLLNPSISRLWLDLFIDKLLAINLTPSRRLFRPNLARYEMNLQHINLQVQRQIRHRTVLECVHGTGWRCRAQVEY